MNKRNLVVPALLLTAILATLGVSTVQAQPFTSIRIGDIDGIGYGVGTGYFAANGGPANVDGLGVLADGDFIPDLNGDGILATGRGDDFDNRSAAEIAGNYVEGIGFSNAGASSGSQFTDIALSTSFDNTFPPPNQFPLPPSRTLSNQPGFVFDFEVAGFAILPGQPLFLNVIFGDYDVTPADLRITRADGTITILPTTVQPGGQDGLLQAAFTALNFADVFASLGPDWKGYLQVDFVAPHEPYTVFDYAEISTEPIVGGPLEIDCPDDIQVGCNEPYDPSVTGTATATGGFPPLTITFADVPGEGIVTRTWTVTDAAGNINQCDQIITLTPSIGTVTGVLTSICPVMGITVDLFNSAGELVGFGVADGAGIYTIPDVPSGETYTVICVAPLGYLAYPADRHVVVPCDGATSASFDLECENAFGGAQRTIGFWKHQFGVACGGKGKAQINAATLCDYLDLIASHFNGNAANPVVIYAPPASGDCADKLLLAKELLNLHGDAGMTARAKQQLMALLLNVVSGKLNQLEVISDDGATVSQAITYCDNLIDDPAGDHEKAKTIADEINNDRTLPAGMIPLGTLHIAYKLNAAVPAGFTLNQNYPNPFNAGTVLSYFLSEGGDTRLEVCDVLGRRVVSLVDGYQPEGTYQVTWDGSDRSGNTVASGIYFYRLTSADQVQTRKMILLK